MSNKNIDIKINSQSTEAKEEHNNKTEEHNKENKRKKYYERKQAGICVGCGKSPAATNRVYCETCAVRINNKRRDKAHANGVRARELFYDGHHCQLCGIEMEFKFNEPKYCSTCLEKLRKTIKYASSFIDKEKARQEHNNFIWYKYKNKYKNSKDTEDNNTEENHTEENHTEDNNKEENQNQ